jgi:hypothetical protein
MSAILKKYKINFYKKNFKNPVSGVNTITPILNTTNDENYILVMFLNDYVNVQDIDTYILNMVEAVLNGSILEEETGSQSGIAVYIQLDKTRLVDFNGVGTYLQPDLIIPTKDFSQISFEWKQFIENV